MHCFYEKFIKQLIFEILCDCSIIALLSFNLIVMKAEKFVALLSDPAVESRLQVILTSKLESVWTDLLPLSIKELVKPIEDKIDSLTATIVTLRQGFDARNATNDKLGKENARLKEKLASCEDYVASLEQYSHRDNLIFNGIPATYAKNTTITDQQNRNGESSATTIDKVIQFCHNKLGGCCNLPLTSQ